MGGSNSDKKRVPDGLEAQGKKIHPPLPPCMPQLYTFVVTNWYYFLNAAGDIETHCHLAEMVGTIANTQDMQAFPLQLRLLFGRRDHT